MLHNWAPATCNPLQVFGPRQHAIACKYWGRAGELTYNSIYMLITKLKKYKIQQETNKRQKDMRTARHKKTRHKKANESKVVSRLLCRPHPVCIVFEIAYGLPPLERARTAQDGWGF